MRTDWTGNALCVVFAGAVIAGVFAPPRASAQQPLSTTPSSAAQEIQSRREARKLELEITKLEVETGKLGKERGLQGDIQRLAPGAAAVLAFAAALLGMARYFREQRENYRLRVEEGVEANLQRLADYGTAGMGWSARVVVALQNLDRLSAQSANRSATRRRVTETVKHAVRDDLDLGKVEQAAFDVVCASHWLPYREFLRSSDAWQLGLLDRYRRALKEMRERDSDVSAFIEHAVWVDGKFKSRTRLDEKPYRHFQRLIAGYRAHVSLIDAGAPYATRRRERARQMLSDGLDNPALAEQLLTERTA